MERDLKRTLEHEARTLPEHDARATPSIANRTLLTVLWNATCGARLSTKPMRSPSIVDRPMERDL